MAAPFDYFAQPRAEYASRGDRQAFHRALWGIRAIRDGANALAAPQHHVIAFVRSLACSKSLDFAESETTINIFSRIDPCRIGAFEIVSSTDQCERVCLAPAEVGAPLVFAILTAFARTVEHVSDMRAALLSHVVSAAQFL